MPRQTKNINKHYKKRNCSTLTKKHGHRFFDVSGEFYGANLLLGPKRSKKYLLQKSHLEASSSIIERVMADLLISVFYNKDFM